MPQKFKILVSAYACSPYKGSEPGMGWNFIIGLSKFHQLHVIVEKRKWLIPIKNYLDLHPNKKQNLTFHFIEKKRNKFLRKLWPPSYYWFYKKWQKDAYNLAVRLDKIENFDIIHQLNMAGYREPGFLWKIDKPFVWGPIGGLENSPWRFLPALGMKGFIFFTSRNLINLFQRNFLKRPKIAATRDNSSLIAATPENKKLIKKLWKKKSEVICEVGQEKNIDKIYFNKRHTDKDPIKIVWSGLHIPRKNLPLLFDAVKRITVPFELHILGDGEMTSSWKKIALKKGFSNCCKWYGWVDRKKALEIMSSGHIFCITSVYDLTSTVTLEALSSALPIISLDHCGFSHVIDDSCGIKVPITNPKKAAQSFASAIEKLFHNDDFRISLAKGAIQRSKDFSWKNKIMQLNNIYESLVK